MPPSKARKTTGAAPLRPADGGYRKGEETRNRILLAALEVFGNNGFETVTTRQIAEAAGINLPGLTYYFGNKEGLYLACAQSIVASFREGVGATATEAMVALRKPMDATGARKLLKQLLAVLARFLLSSSTDQGRTLFVRREIASPGPAFEILYTELWLPGIEVTAQLLNRATSGRLSEPASKVRAIMMIASLTGFQSGRRVIARAAGDTDQVEEVIAALHEQIDALASI